MDRIYDQPESFKESRNKKDTSETYNKDRGLVEFDTHKTFRRQERQRKTLSILSNEFMKINDRTGLEKIIRRQTLFRITKGKFL